MLKATAMIGLGSLYQQQEHNLPDIKTHEGAIDWNAVRAQFPIVAWDQIHFNSGSAGVMPYPVLKRLSHLIQEMNAMAPYEVWDSWKDIRKKTIDRLATMTNVSSSEIEIVRNTTEALNLIISGVPMASGDHVICSEHDYPYVLNTWTNRSRRDGIEVQSIHYDLPSSDDTIIDTYRKAISAKTRVIHVTHMTHRQGHIMPVKRLAQLAHDHDAQLVVDGAHSIAQDYVDLRDLDCDYYATSLHKWLNAPHGTGLIYVKGDRIDQLAGHLSSYPSSDGSIRKYEERGTRAFHQEIGIAAALDFHDIIGLDAKYKRLQYLKRYWTEYLKDNPAITWHTDTSTKKSIAITTFSIDGMSANQVWQPP